MINIKMILYLQEQSWLRDGTFSEARFPISGIRDRDFLFLARSENLENPGIPGIDIEIWKARINPENPKIPGIGKIIAIS